MGKSRVTRFISRILTQMEKERLQTSAGPDTMLWALWAGKETAYKVVRKSHAAVSSAPRAYEVNFVGNGMMKLEKDFIISGAVETPCDPVTIRTFKTRNHIHCIGTDGESKTLDSVVWEVRRVEEDMGVLPRFESFFVREAAKERLSLCLNRNPDEIEIRRFKGPYGLEPPVVYVKDTPVLVDISLSHDGKFVAYAFATDSSS
jgi:hypothetical protein